MCTVERALKDSFGIQMLVLFFCVTIFIPLVLSYSYKQDEMAPIILVPGVAGSRIEAKYHTHGEPRLCDSKSDWEVIWINLAAAAGGIPLKCWVYRYQLIYNRTTHRCQNQLGVETRVMGKFGSLKPVDYLTRDPVSRLGTNYFEDISDALKAIGYSTDVNLKAAAYDGRYAPIQQQEFGYFDRFTQLVEKVASDSNRKVALVSHSMACLMAAQFLLGKTQEWKDKYIHAFISISTPWLGAVMALESYIVGTNYGVPTFKRSRMKKLIPTFQSVAYLLPAEGAYGQTVLVDWTAKNKKYTARNYKELFTDLNFENGYLMREDVRSLFPVNINKLGVKMYCIWSNLTETKTLETYELSGALIDPDPKTVKSIYVDGDGTVTRKSLNYCHGFKDVTVKHFEGYDHLNIIFKEDVISYVQSVSVKAQPFS